MPDDFTAGERIGQNKYPSDKVAKVAAMKEKPHIAKNKKVRHHDYVHEAENTALQWEQRLKIIRYSYYQNISPQRKGIQLGSSKSQTKRTGAARLPAMPKASPADDPLALIDREITRPCSRDRQEATRRREKQGVEIDPDRIVKTQKLGL